MTQRLNKTVAVFFGLVILAGSCFFSGVNNGRVLFAAANGNNIAGSAAGGIMPPMEEPDYNADQADTDSQGANETVLYSTNRYAQWLWYKGVYPDNMAMGVITDGNMEPYEDSLPKPLLETMQNIDYNNNFVIFAFLGTAPNGNNIGIENVMVNGADSILVHLRTKSLKSTDKPLRGITEPFSYVVLSKNMLDNHEHYNVSYVDEDENELGKHDLSLSQL